jgi:hypothetical protein
MSLIEKIQETLSDLLVWVLALIIQLVWSVTWDLIGVLTILFWAIVSIFRPSLRDKVSIMAYDLYTDSELLSWAKASIRR